MPSQSLIKAKIYAKITSILTPAFDKGRETWYNNSAVCGQKLKAAKTAKL